MAVTMFRVSQHVWVHPSLLMDRVRNDSPPLAAGSKHRVTFDGSHPTFYLTSPLTDDQRCDDGDDR